MSQRLTMVFLITGATAFVSACGDGDHQGTLLDNSPKDDSGSSHPGHDASTGDHDQDDDPDPSGDDAGVDDELDAGHDLDAGHEHDSGHERDASAHQDAASDDGGTDAAVPSTMPLSAAGQIIITEFMAAPFTATGEDDDGEWVEIYNPSATVSYQLKDCTFSDKVGDADYAFADITIAPHAYLALSSVDFTAEVQGFVSDVVYGTKSGLSGSGDSPVIACKGTIIDKVDYSALSFLEKPDASEGHTLQLSPSALDGTQNDDGANWCFSTKSYGTVTTVDGDRTNYGTPKGENDPCP
ncbi:MAG: lamin tail domain-containing protein [Myxococcales bacterium]